MIPPIKYVPLSPTEFTKVRKKNNREGSEEKTFLQTLHLYFSILKFLGGNVPANPIGTGTLAGKYHSLLYRLDKATKPSTHHRPLK